MKERWYREYWCDYCQAFTNHVQRRHWHPALRLQCERCLQRGSRYRIALVIALVLAAFIYGVRKLWV